jgi:hypothetical protein
MAALGIDRNQCVLPRREFGRGATCATRVMHSKAPLIGKGLLDANYSGATIPKFLGYARAATGGRNVTAKLKPLRGGGAKKRFCETASRAKTALLRTSVSAASQRRLRRGLSFGAGSHADWRRKLLIAIGMNGAKFGADSQGTMHPSYRLTPARRVNVLSFCAARPAPGDARGAALERELSRRAISPLTQWMAAYMIFSSVASSAENSSTTLPWRETRTRSDSAMISGR